MNTIKGGLQVKNYEHRILAAEDWEHYFKRKTKFEPVKLFYMLSCHSQVIHKAQES